MTLEKKRWIITAVVAAIIFGAVSFMNPWSFVLDAPLRYGVPLTFREVGCGMGRVINGQIIGSCVDRWKVVSLLLDIAIVALPAYGIVRLTTRKSKTP